MDFSGRSYFEFYEITENHKLSIALCYLNGTALQWYQWLFQNKQLADWKHFTEKVLIRFLKCHLESPEDSLSNLQQWSNTTNSLFAETQSDTQIEIAGKKATSIENIAVQFFNGHPQENCQRGEIPVDEVIPDVECEKSYWGEEHDEGVLLVASVTEIAFSMKFCQGCSNIVMDEFKEILKTSSFYMANTFIDQRLLTQFQFNLGATTSVVPVHEIASNLYVWDPGISFEFLFRTGSNTNVETHALFEEITKKRSRLLVNSYVSKIIETKIDVGDISDILLQADKSDTNDSPVEGSNCTWFCLHPTTHDLTLVLLEPLSSYSTITGGQSLSIGFSVGINFGAESDDPVRYPDDPFDRIWTSNTIKKANCLVDVAAGTERVSTKISIDVNTVNGEMPSQKVM
ncbi:hypothetical protein KY289_018385 [Solanum tuberosum]|nr:hypothetical protein KY289_018385 [Solanum tuberosum]